MIHNHLLNNVARELEDHEGFADRPYLDTVGVWTFGHGLTYITEDESLMVMRYRLETEYIPQLRVLFPMLDDLTPNRQEVLLNMTYNLGIRGVAGFKRMIQAIGVLDFKQASIEMLDSKWAVQVGQRAIDLADKMRAG